MTRDHARQFPPPDALDWPDPALIDREFGTIEPQPVPGWWVWLAGAARDWRSLMVGAGLMAIVILV